MEINKIIESWSADELFKFFRTQNLQVLNLTNGDYKLLRNKRITGASFLYFSKTDLSLTGLEWGPCVELNKLKERVEGGKYVCLFH
jgi:hypothetical protein